MAEGVEDADEGGEEASSLGLKIPKTPAMLVVELKALDEPIKEVAQHG